MPNYHAYFMGPDDSFQTFRILDCPDDATAIAEASVLSARQDIELWHRSRKVARLTPSDPRSNATSG